MPVGQQMYAGFGYVPTLLDVSLYAAVSVCSAPLFLNQKSSIETLNAQNILLMES